MPSSRHSPTELSAAAERAGAGPTAADRHLLEHHLSGEQLLGGGFLNVHRDTVQLPDGSQATREYILHPGAVAVIPLLDDGRLVLVRQFRYPLGKLLLEFPAGKRDAGESTLVCAQRELQEETGYTAAEWAYAGELHNAAAYSTESIWIWFARGLQPGPRRLDAGEFVETVLMRPDELLALDAQHLLPDAKTLIGLHWLGQVQGGARSCEWQPQDQAQDPPGLVAARPVVPAPEAASAAESRR